MARSKSAKVNRATSKPTTRASRRLNGKGAAAAASDSTQYDSDSDVPSVQRQYEPEPNLVKAPGRMKFNRTSLSKKQTHEQPYKAARKPSEFYYTDDEDEYWQGRFSELYGHGVPLDETSMHGARAFEDQPISNGKRKASTTAGTPSPKKVRFDRGSDETRIAQEGSTTSVPVSPAEKTELLDEYPELPQEAPDYHLSNLVSQPERLSLGRMSTLINQLRTDATVFAENWFGRPQSRHPAACPPTEGTFPMHDLKHKYPTLYYSTVYLLDASTTNGKESGWAEFYEKPESRAHLVNAIIGEWFTQRIFKDSAFGLKESFRFMMEVVDKQWIHFDSFIRAKKRALLLKGLLEEGIEVLDLHGAGEQLAGELLTVFEPLVATFGSECLYDSIVFNKQLFNHLTGLVVRAAALHLSIILSGEDGTVVRTAPTFLKGRAWQPSMPMKPVNAEIVDKKPSGMSDAELTVKMVCWPRVEAYQPHGLDLEEMAAVQRQLMRSRVASKSQLEEVTMDRVASMIKQKKWKGEALSKESLDGALAKARKRIQARANVPKFCWDCSANGMKAFPQLPLELHNDFKEQQNKEEQRWRMYDSRRQTNNMDVNKGEAADRSDSDDDAQSQVAADAQPEDHRAVRPEDDSDDSDPRDSDMTVTSASISTESVTSDDEELASKISGDDSLGNLDMLASRYGESEAEEPPRGSYVTIFTCINPHVVYLEWSKPEAQIERELVAAGTVLNGKSVRQINSLQATIDKSREQAKSRDTEYHAGNHASVLRLRYEDAQLRLWKFYATNNLKIEWFAVLAAIVTCVGRGNPSKGIQSSVRTIINLVLSSANLTSTVAKGAASTGILVLTQLHNALQEAASRLFGTHLPRPDVSELVDRAQFAVYEGLDSLKECWTDVFHALFQILPQPTSPISSSSADVEGIVHTLATPTPVIPIPLSTAVASTGVAAGLAAFFSSRLYGSPNPVPAPVPTPLPTIKLGPVITLPQVTSAARAGGPFDMDEQRPKMKSYSKADAAFGNADRSMDVREATLLRSYATETAGPRADYYSAWKKREESKSRLAEEDKAWSSEWDARTGASNSKTRRRSSRDRQ